MIVTRGETEFCLPIEGDLGSLIEVKQGDLMEIIVLPVLEHQPSESKRHDEEHIQRIARLFG